MARRRHARTGGQGDRSGTSLPDRFSAGLSQLSASEWAVWIATSVLCTGAYVRHGLPLATLYFLGTAAFCAVDPSLHSLQLLNLAAVVYDLSFELHRLYMLVSNRPMLMVAIMIVALAVEWLLERYEAEDSNDDRPRGALGGIARLGRSVGRMLLPAVMGVLIACVGWLVLTAALLHPSSFSAPLVEAVEQVRTEHTASAAHPSLLGRHSACAVHASSRGGACPGHRVTESHIHAAAPRGLERRWLAHHHAGACAALTCGVPSCVGGVRGRARRFRCSARATPV
jgi:hypothetical protein